MKTYLTATLLLIAIYCLANMASPLIRGTEGIAPLCSNDISITKEILRININKDFKTANYAIDYFIHTDSAGRQVPLLFAAANYLQGFRIWVDSNEVFLQKIPSQYIISRQSPFNKFSGQFKAPLQDGEPETVEITWHKNSSTRYKFSDLKYFEAALTKGNHVIHAEYDATATVDRSGWVKSYSYPYYLSPAKNWKGFGGLDILLNTSGFDNPVTTNIGAPLTGSTDSVAYWHFNNLPVDVLQVNYNPTISSTARLLLQLQPTGIAACLALLLTILHITILALSKPLSNPSGYKAVFVAGVVIIPLLIPIAYMYAYSLIDNTIGSEASNFHGYYFLVFIYYPLFLAFYWFVTFIASLLIKKYARNNYVP